MHPNGRKLARFPGGLKLRPYKRISTREPLRNLPLPHTVTLAVDQHIGNPAIPCVDIGDQVLRGQMVARASGLISAPVHASISGTVVAIEDRQVPHPSGLAAPVVVVESDGRDEPATDCRAIGDFTQLSPTELTERIRDAGIVGLGGATFPTAVKLDTGRDHRLEGLVLNGVECEPYISCDDMLMRERAEQIVLGARAMMHALQVEQCIFSIDENKPEAIDSVRGAIRSSGDPRFELVIAAPVYPAGGERQLLQVITGQEVPSDGLPADIGYVCQNVGTAAAVAHLLTTGEPLISRIVTVTGAGINAPANFETRIGTSMGQLVDACGGYNDRVERLIMGGPMMGFAMPSDELPVVKATNCILAATAVDLRHAEEQACIRCGDCAGVCPASLLPQQLLWHIHAHAFDDTERFSLFDCIECGCCDYVCPSHIPLTQYFRYAKGEIRARRHQRERSEIARRRFEHRKSRQEAEEHARQERLEAKRRALGTTHIGKVESGAAEKVLERVAAKERATEPADDGNDK